MGASFAEPAIMSASRVCVRCRACDMRDSHLMPAVSTRDDSAEQSTVEACRYVPG